MSKLQGSTQKDVKVPQNDRPPRTLQAVDLQASFEESSAGREAKRVIDFEGKEQLNRSVWEAGLSAYNFLEINCDGATSPEGYRRWVTSATEFLKDDFYPDLLELVKNGRVILSSGSPAQFEAAWVAYDWVERLDVFLGVLDQARAHAASEPPDHESFKGYVAAALLRRIDDAVISVFCDGRGLSENIVDIVQLRDRLTPTPLQKMTFDAAIGAARKEIGKAGAAAKLARDPKQREKAEVRECWDAWQAEPARYKGVAAFARDMLTKFESLESQPVIERWSRVWTKERAREN